jgi:hypothetical protein
MRRGGVGNAWLAMGMALACGGQAGADLARRSTDVPSSIDEGRPDAGSSEVEPPPPPIVRDPPAPPPFDDPGCPPVVSMPGPNQCDPLAVPTGCPEGQSCFPFVDYPRGPCDVERFGTICQPAGTGTQGDPCGEQDCAADYICVSTGRGTQCVRLCTFDVDQSKSCDPGLLCLPIDIDGFGGCL